MITYLAVHHFGSSALYPKASTKGMTETELNKLHKERWSDFPSKLNGSFIGYNIVIYPNGEYKQYRYIGEETAAQKGHNLDTISVCLAGNFSHGADIPTLSQVASLKKIMRACVYGKPEDIGLKVLPNTIIAITKKNIVPHRILQPHTACYGSYLSDTWASNLLDILTLEEEKTLVVHLTDVVKRLIEQITALKKKKRLSGLPHRCWDDVRG